MRCHFDELLYIFSWVIIAEPTSEYRAKTDTSVLD